MKHFHHLNQQNMENWKKNSKWWGDKTPRDRRQGKCWWRSGTFHSLTHSSLDNKIGAKNRLHRYSKSLFLDGGGGCGCVGFKHPGLIPNHFTEKHGCKTNQQKGKINGEWSENKTIPLFLLLKPLESFMGDGFNFKLVFKLVMSDVDWIIGYYLMIFKEEPQKEAGQIKMQKFPSKPYIRWGQIFG
jgi:hypothetical protein